MNHPRIAFCTTCKGRAQHIKQTLPKNLADNDRYPNAVFVIVDYGSEDDLLPYLRQHHAKDILTGRVVIYSLRAQGSFRMAHAKNVAHRCGILEGADILVNLDADNYTGAGFAEYVAHEFEGRDRIFLWACMIRGVLDRGISGRIICRTRDFMKVCGYDERFEKWSPDDKDFNLRMRRLGLEPIEIDPRFLTAVRHTEKMRFREYPEARGTPYDVDAFKDSVNPQRAVVNTDGYGCAPVASRNFAASDMWIAPLPTRIFGIGMHKTGTTSLHTALQMLGLDSAHWKSAHWAKAIWTEMRDYGYSPTLERHYALCDLPLPLLYKELDQAYPGSKFILTMRDESAWLASVEKHWSYDRNPFRQVWDTDAFTHQIHCVLYGRKMFDADIFLKRYRQHNAQVMHYFRNRPNDLLVLDMGSVRSWEKLCGFLDRPMPLMAFPKVNDTL